MHVKEGYFFTPHKQVTSPTCGSPPPCKQALNDVVDLFTLLQHTRVAVASARWSFLLFLSLKTIKNASRQMRQLYAYVANEPTRRLAEDGMSMGLTNKHTARGFSVVSRVRSKTMHSLFCIMSPYTTLCNIASRFILPWNFRAWLYWAVASQPRVFARLLVGNKFMKLDFFWISHGFWSSLSS